MAVGIRDELLLSQFDYGQQEETRLRVIHANHARQSIAIVLVSF